MIMEIINDISVVGLPGRGSELTWMAAPVLPRISLILLPSLPMIAPHWEAGTRRLRLRSWGSRLSSRDLDSRSLPRFSLPSRVLQMRV